MQHKFLAFISRSNYKKSHSHQLDKFTPLSNRIREIYNVGNYFKAIEENPIPSHLKCAMVSGEGKTLHFNS